jgi:hypothetical protein
MLKDLKKAFCDANLPPPCCGPASFALAFSDIGTRKISVLRAGGV